MAWPTTSDPRTEFVTLRLTVGERATLEAAASSAGQKPSVYLREAMARVIAADNRKYKKQTKEQPA